MPWLWADTLERDSDEFEAAPEPTIVDEFVFQRYAQKEAETHIHG